MLRLLQMAFLGSIFQKFCGGGMPPDPPRMSHAFGARLHDHSHDAGFATGASYSKFPTVAWYSTSNIMPRGKHSGKVFPGIVFAEKYHRILVGDNPNPILVPAHLMLNSMITLMEFNANHNSAKENGGCKNTFIILYLLR